MSGKADSIDILYELFGQITRWLTSLRHRAASVTCGAACTLVIVVFLPTSALAMAPALHDDASQVTVTWQKVATDGETDTEDTLTTNAPALANSSTTTPGEAGSNKSKNTPHITWVLLSSPDLGVRTPRLGSCPDDEVCFNGPQPLAGTGVGCKTPTTPSTAPEVVVFCPGAFFRVLGRDREQPTDLKT